MAAEEQGILGIPKKFYSLKYGWMSIPLGLIFGLFIVVYLILELLFEKGIQSKRAGIRWFTYFMLCVFLMDYVMWVITKDGQLHDDYLMLFLYSLGVTAELYLLLVIPPYLYLVNKRAKENKQSFSHQLIDEVFDEVDDDGNSIPTPEASNVLLEEARANSKKNDDMKLHASAYADRRFNEEYKQSDASYRLWMTDNEEELLENYKREWEHSDEYSVWEENYGKAEEPPKPRKPRKPKASKA